MSPRPNVIVFFTDQQRWDSTGPHGNPLDLTPNLDRLAEEGTHCEQAFTPAPVCGPARACMQTGTYYTRNGCYRNSIPLPDDLPTLAQCFGQAGYRTGYIGKWHLGDREVDGVVGPTRPAQRGGYQDWLASNVLEFTSNAYHTRMWDTGNEPVDLPGYRVDALTDAAIRYVDERSREESPFFLFLSFLEPHHQNHVDDYPPPTGYRERYTGRWIPPDLAELKGSAHRHLGGYWGMVKRLDEALGRLTDALKSRELEEDTIVLFTSDHGCHFKTRNGEYKRSCHESSIHVPMAFVGPGFTGGGRVRRPVSLVDVAPTLLEAAGVTVPDSMQGRPLRPLLRGEAEDWPEDAFVQVCDAHYGRAVRTRRWKYGVMTPEGEPVEKGMAGRYEEAFLYDLEHDPHELMNLIHSRAHDPVRDRMRERLRAWMRGVGEPDPEILTVESSPRRGQRQVSQWEIEA